MRKKDIEPLTLDRALWRHGALTETARELGISRGYLCDIRKGRVRPSTKLAEDISRLTGVSIETLLNGQAA
jgi:transcriptional regulator with XRE-family HTH domain